MHANTHNLVEEGENRASTILVGHLKPFFHTLGSDMNLFGLIFEFQEPLVMLVAILINFGVKNHLPQLSFKIDAGELMSVLFYEFSNILFCE